MAKTWGTVFGWFSLLSFATNTVSQRFRSSVAGVSWPLGCWGVQLCQAERVGTHEAFKSVALFGKIESSGHMNAIESHFGIEKDFEKLQRPHHEILPLQSKSLHLDLKAQLLCNENRCGRELYHSQSKWKGPCAWPSFRCAASEDALLMRPVVGYGSYRCAVAELYCAKCHLFVGAK